jgi:uncharacterized protein (TIGR02145 family)
VEDGTCICPAKKNATEWLNFMCHNLGGIDIISPSQLITYEHHGDWYRFGAKNLSVVNTGTNNSAVIDWNSLPVYSDDADWPSVLNDNIGNPCPAGWRLPTDPEWTNVINNNNYANVPAATWASGETVFSNLKKLGDDLILPSAGYRNTSGGLLGNRGYYGYYWSSTGYGSGYGWRMGVTSGSPDVGYANRKNGFSVRCVQAE